MDTADAFNHWVGMQKEYDQKIKEEIVRKFYGPKDNKFEDWHENAIDVEYEVIEETEIRLLESPNEN